MTYHSYHDRVRRLVFLISVTLLVLLVVRYRFSSAIGAF